MNTENIIKELKPIDYFKKKNNTLFNDSKILILNDLDDEFMFFFINKNLIATDIADENEFIANFKST
jgi:hypothetical protein